MILDLPDPDLHNQSEDKEVVLSIKNVSKRFCRDLKRSLLYGVQDISGEIFGSQRQDVQLRKGEFWALKDVNLELRRGEALGLVGANGAGKTTLLRIISGLITPDHGSVEVKGRVAPLIALGAGFNPILTGRENVYVNMSILGLSKQEIEARFDEVVEFAEIGEAIDSPVQSYSSGMAARLGFACAIHTEPDILLIDEVLAVGDIKFRSKCYRKLSLLREKGVGFVMVSHDANSIIATCNNAILLSKGEILESGNVADVMQKYDEMLFSVKDKTIENSLFLPKKDKSDSTGVDITYLCFKDINSDILEYPLSGTPTMFCIGINSHKETNIYLSLLISNKYKNNERILNLNTLRDKQFFRVGVGEHEIQLEMPYLCLTSGQYVMKMSVLKDNLYMYDAVESFDFLVKDMDSNSIECEFFQPRKWQIIHLNEFNQNIKVIS